MDKYNVKIRLNNCRTIEIYNATYVTVNDDNMFKVTYLLAKHGDEAVIYIPVHNIEIIYVNPVVDHSKEEKTDNTTAEVDPTQKVPENETEG